MSIVEIVIINIFIILWLFLLAEAVIKRRYDPNTLGFLASGMQALGNMKAGSRAQNQNNIGTIAALMMEDKAYKKEQEYMKPWQDFGEKNLVSFKDLLGYNGADKQAAAMEALKTSPAYQFRLNQGVGALDRSAIKRGGLNSGRQMMALEDFGQGLASEEYGNEFNRRLGLADRANSTAGTMASLGGNYYRNKGNLFLGQALRNADIQKEMYSKIGAAGQQAADNAYKWVGMFMGGKGGGGGGNDPYGGGGSTSLYGSGRRDTSIPDNSAGTYYRY